VWERIQSKCGKTRKRPTSSGEKSIFSGFLVCADCGHNLHYHFNQGNPDIKYFNCSNYNSSRGTCPTTHYIRVDFLEQVVLGEIRRLMKFAGKYEEEFARIVMGHTQQNAEAERQRKQKELYALNARDRELDKLFNRMYEDNVAGQLDDERFARMSRQYTSEQKELAEKSKALTTELERDSGKTLTIDTFIKTVRQYTRAKKLTERMLSELIEKIEVHQSERADGVNMQRLTIHWNCIGSIEIPDHARLPAPEVYVHTRQGVATSYVPA
jgi:hypothetical protein